MKYLTVSVVAKNYHRKVLNLLLIVISTHLVSSLSD